MFVKVVFQPQIWPHSNGIGRIKQLQIVPPPDFVQTPLTQTCPFGQLPSGHFFCAFTNVGITENINMVMMKAKNFFVVCIFICFKFYDVKNYAVNFFSLKFAIAVFNPCYFGYFLPAFFETIASSAGIFTNGLFGIFLPGVLANPEPI